MTIFGVFFLTETGQDAQFLGQGVGLSGDEEREKERRGRVRARESEREKREGGREEGREAGRVRGVTLLRQTLSNTCVSSRREEIPPAYGAPLRFR